MGGMAMIKNYFFDCGDVLLNLDVQRTIDCFAKLWRTDADGRMAFSTHDLFGVGTNRLMADFQTGAIHTDDFVKTLIPNLRPGTTPEQILEAWDAMLLDVPQCRIDALRRLKRNGFKVFILSNNNDEHLRWILDYFDKIGIVEGREIDEAYYSNLIGSAKPDPDLFRVAIERSGVDPAETLYFDDMEKNTIAGAKFGLQTICATGKEIDWEADILCKKTF